MKTAALVETYAMMGDFQSLSFWNNGGYAIDKINVTSSSGYVRLHVFAARRNIYISTAKHDVNEKIVNFVLAIEQYPSALQVRLMHSKHTML